MEDSKIVELFWIRSEQAIHETSMKYGKYGKYCNSIAYNILANVEDTEEAVNDTYLGAWNAIPPHKPSILATFLGKIVRRISLNMWRNKHRGKRNSQVTLALEELGECVPSNSNVEDDVVAGELTQLLNGFLSDLPLPERHIFLRRYWYLDSIKQICNDFGFSSSKVKSILYRTRNKLLIKLEQEGY